MAELEPSGRVLVAVSGGPDSTALLVALHEAGRDVAAAHYDHALREGSEAVAAQVGALCERLGVRLLARRRTEPLPKGSLQAAARSLRYAFLEAARVEERAGAVALAHTADDLVEGAVLHLLRGCGLAGLRGMPARRGAYVRPFLGVWRSDIERYLEEHGIVPHRDPANFDTRFARVRVRLSILPALERDRPGIVRRLHRVALAASARQAEAAGRAAEALDSGPPAAAAVRRLPEPVAVEVLKLMYVRAGGSEPGLSRAHLDSMLGLAQPGRGGRGVDLPGGLRFRIVGDHMHVVPRVRESTASPRIDVRPCVGCGDRGAAHLRAGLPLRVGFRTPGLRMHPLGGRGSRKLQDIFVDARVPREDRDGWPLVFAGDRLAWVPGVAVDADLATRDGEPGLHVALSPMPVPSASNLVRLETPHRTRGDLS